MISVVGIGPGERKLLTVSAIETIEQADLLVGWKRVLELFPDVLCEKAQIGCDLNALMELLKTSIHRNVVVLASGDPLLFGVGKRISETFGPDQCRFINGISAVQYMFGRIGLDMNDVYLTSSHGKQPDYDLIARLSKVAIVTDKENGPYEIACEMKARSTSFTMYVGENLSYSGERIEQYDLTASLPPRDKAYQLNVVVLNNERQ
ncbi:precorrin-6y C5,15-methyltransferase (decarboxylating) subunit CbiE [Vibrio salinus]|uniref:precorrin-6y C5,15-methyltransferase (decarboxylating) subunit CbiE n=1 Tax=Vibrio salinus TaxID=2899784 RepID=UPI001E510856|nr:precorrin-6y C5,15-methyltransferase (decarboxylating) subunit CbiE [Vibrio salinus]MCE0495666.1 precorrin-6y C5,15-methyltransferase (decarboxylating) subunit CbiE [Vibrio salinus]